MSSALLWILLPAALGIALLFYRRDDALPKLIGVGFALFLSWAAWQLPVDVLLQLGPLTIEIAPSLVLFGRNFTLTGAEAPLLGFFYLMLALWILGAHLARPGRLFVPIALISVALLVAALAVEPFLYAAVLIAIAALLLVLLLVPPGSQAGPGVMRFLEFQIFAVPFILFTGWILTGVEASPGNLDLVLRAGLLLAMGFVFLLSLFPFHSWMPMLAKEAHPYAFGFLVFYLPATALIFGLGFFDRYSWLRESDFAYPILAIAGSIAVLASGLWAARESNLARVFAFAAMLTVGFSLQAIGSAQGAEVFFATLLPAAFAFWAWALALSALHPLPSLTLEDLHTLAPAHPLALAAVLLSLFTLAGFPPLGAFPGRIALLDGVAATSPWAAIASLVGSFGLLAAGLRILQAALPSMDTKSRSWVEEATPARKAAPKPDASDPYMWVFIGLVSVALLGFGLLPSIFLGALPKLAAMFSQLLP
jgi:NADH-quinone oxidoreductase subunit N